MPTIHYTFIHRHPSLARLRELALSVVLSSRHYDVVIHTNLDLRRYKLPAQIKWRTFVEKIPWSIHKLETYAEAKDDPFIHLDSDAFLFKPLPQDLLEGDLFAQNIEYLTLYGSLAKLPEDWRKDYVLPISRFRAYNMGLFGGNPIQVELYALFALAAAHNAPPNAPPTAVEQATLGRFADDNTIDVKTLLPSMTCTEVDGYSHLMFDKHRPETGWRVADRLEQEAPEIADRLSAGPLRPQSTKITLADVKEFWRDKEALPKSTPAGGILATTHTLTNTPTGLGDTLVLTGVLEPARKVKVNASIWTTSSHLPALREFMPLYLDRQHGQWVSLSAAGYGWDLGAGHNIQRACRLLGLPVPWAPRGHVVVPGRADRKKTRVTLHLDPGVHADHQRRFDHPRARLVNDAQVEVIRQFIDEHPDLEFYEVGAKRRLSHAKVHDFTGQPLNSTIHLMAQCGYHIGILSGPAHLATALGLRVILLTVMPKPSELMIPCLVDNGVVEAEWIPPTACVLHQEIDSPHWPILSLENLNNAFDGKVWPYWQWEEMEE